VFIVAAVAISYNVSVRQGGRRRMGGWEQRRRRPGPTAKSEPGEAAAFASEIRSRTRGKSSYREQSLRIHGLICAKCGREFEPKDRNLLTVHHKDGDHRNNPPDGSNWENLCVYCHEDEHSRDRLGRYFGGEGA
jgi:hypothetical protein